VGEDENKTPLHHQLKRGADFLPGGWKTPPRRAGFPYQVAQVGSMWTLFFAPEPVVDYDTAKKTDTSLFARFFWAMMDRGIYLPCSQFEAAFISAVHTDEHIKQTIGAAEEALGEMAKG